MCTQVSSQQKNKKIIPQNFFHLSPVSLTPVINIHSRLSPRIFEKIRISIAYSEALGTMIYEKNLMSKISCQTPFTDIFFLRGGRVGGGAKSSDSKRASPFSIIC